MSGVLREVHVVAHDSESTNGWYWYPTRARAAAAYEEEVGIWSGDAHVRLLRNGVPLFFDNDETTDWIQNNAAEEDFAGWDVIERSGPLPSGMTDPHPADKETPSMTDDQSQTPETNLQPGGYTYKAENYCAHHALTNLERNMNNPLFDVHALLAVTEDDDTIFEVAAEFMEIDHHNPHSYDSDVFPKPFTAEEADPEEFCGDCGYRFRDGVHLLPFTITGVVLQNGQQIFGHVGVGHIGQALYACFTEDEDGVTRWASHVMAEDPEKAIQKVQEKGLHFDDAEPPSANLPV